MIKMTAINKVTNVRTLIIVLCRYLLIIIISVGRLPLLDIGLPQVSPQPLLDIGLPQDRDRFYASRIQRVPATLIRSSIHLLIIIIIYFNFQFNISTFYFIPVFIVHAGSVRCTSGYTYGLIFYVGYKRKSFTRYNIAILLIIILMKQLSEQPLLFSTVYLAINHPLKTHFHR